MLSGYDRVMQENVTSPTRGATEAQLERAMTVGTFYAAAGRRGSRANQGVYADTLQEVLNETEGTARAEVLDAFVYGTTQSLVDVFTHLHEARQPEAIPA